MVHSTVRMDDNDREQGDPHLFAFASQSSSGLAQDLVSSRHPEQGKKDSGEAMERIQCEIRQQRRSRSPKCLGAT